jgi:hypothetical protein
MNPRVKKILLLALTALLLFTSGRVQNSLNRDRAQLGLTIAEPLQNAPPMLAFTTVALGGFRGLISNFLWIRANNLQQDDKFFEAAQLADWITDLEPHFAQVWTFQAWNMAYNISVKFKENAPGIYSDRWRWVERGIGLLRDHGLRYNPDEPLLYAQLAWIFQHKMGQNLDDANIYYKQEWAREMTPFFGPGGTNFTALIDPQTAGEKTNALVLREQYNIDPVFGQNVDTQYGPLDWRLPEAHAIYWYARGLEMAKDHPGKVADDLITLRRGIYQSILQAFKHGRIITDPFSKTYSLVPNLDLVTRANDIYLQMYADETNPNQKDGILNAHRNFLRDAVYFLYEDNRVAEAAKWYKMIGEKYPDKNILDTDPNSFPRNLTLDEYAVARVQEDVGDNTSQERMTGVVKGLLVRAYYSLAIGQDDRYEGFKMLAGKIYQSYVLHSIGHGNNQDRVQLPPFAVLNRTVLNDLLDTQKPVLPFAARAVIRSNLGMLAEANPPAITSTNLPTVSTTNSAAK